MNLANRALLFLPWCSIYPDTVNTRIAGLSAFHQLCGPGCNAQLLWFVFGHTCGHLQGADAMEWVSLMVSLPLGGVHTSTRGSNPMEDLLLPCWFGDGTSCPSGSTPCWWRNRCFPSASFKEVAPWRSQVCFFIVSTMISPSLASLMLWGRAQPPHHFTFGEINVLWHERDLLC